MLINPIFGPGIAAMDTHPATLSSEIEKLPGYAQALFDTHPIHSGDVLILVSVSGRNAVPIEMAKIGQQRGVKVIGLTSSEYADGLNHVIHLEKRCTILQMSCWTTRSQKVMQSFRRTNPAKILPGFRSNQHRHIAGYGCCNGPGTAGTRNHAANLSGRKC